MKRRRELRMFEENQQEIRRMHTMLIVNRSKPKNEEKKWRCIIPERNTLKMCWDYFILLCVIFVSLVLPYRFAFDFKEHKVYHLIGYLIDFSFLIDISLTFISADFDEEEFRDIEDHKEIAVRYLKGWFIIDLISIVPFDLILHTNQNILKSLRISRLIKLYRLLRLLRVSRLLKNA